MFENFQTHITVQMLLPWPTKFAILSSIYRWLAITRSGSGWNILMSLNGPVILSGWKGTIYPNPCSRGWSGVTPGAMGHPHWCESHCMCLHERKGRTSKSRRCTAHCFIFGQKPGGKSEGNHEWRWCLRGLWLSWKRHISGQIQTYTCSTHWKTLLMLCIQLAIFFSSYTRSH